ncbi:MAG: 5'-methylthioadenosine nucleosidase [Planctomycetaceae bacterium]
MTTDTPEEPRPNLPSIASESTASQSDPEVTSEPENTPPPVSEQARADVGIVAALKIELAPFLQHCDRIRQYSGGKFTFRGGFLKALRVATVESGPGRAKAEQATQALIDGHDPKWIISIGFAGGLSDNLAIGDLLVATSVVDVEEGDLEASALKIDIKMASNAKRGLHVGRLATARDIVRTVAEKQDLAARSQALAVDMETYGVASVCSERKRKFLAIRSISDDCSRDLPPEVLSILGRTGSVRAGAVLGALWNRPSSYKDLWKLRQNANRAADRLAQFLVAMLPQLCEPGDW